MAPFRTRDKDVVCANAGGLRPPPTPQFSFYAVQACFQEHRTISKTGFTRTTVIELFNPTTLAVHLRTTGLRPPQPPHFFKLYKATSSIILPAKTEPIWPLSERVIKTTCVQMGGAAPPPTPPLFFLRRADLLSRTSYHQPELFQKSIMQADGGATSPPTLALS